MVAVKSFPIDRAPLWQLRPKAWAPLLCGTQVRHPGDKSLLQQIQSQTSKCSCSRRETGKCKDNNHQVGAAGQGIWLGSGSGAGTSKGGEGFGKWSVEGILGWAKTWWLTSMPGALENGRRH